MTLSERQLEAMWRWVHEAARRHIEEFIAGPQSEIDRLSRALLAVESEETPAPRNPCGYTGGVCHCDVCMSPREASVPATRGAEHDGWSVEEILEKWIALRTPYRDDACTTDLRTALRLYREERPASEAQNTRLVDLLRDLNEVADRRQRETITAVRERDEARERIERALDALPMKQGAYYDLNHTRAILRGDEKK